MRAWLRLTWPEAREMKKLILIDCDGVVLNWDDAFEWWIWRKYGIKKEDVTEYTGGVYGRYNLTFNTGPLNWMDLVAEFNESVDCENLPPLRDSIKYIRKLHEEHGYVFTAITSFSLDPHSQEIRRSNLRRYFGSAIYSVEFADLCADKSHLLLPYEGSGIPWVEDKLGNAEIGADLGLDCYMMMHQYNLQDALNTEKPITFVGDWAELYQKLVG